MVTLRCTRKLLARLQSARPSHAPPSTTRLGDWYANTLDVGRLRLVLCVNERSRLSVVLHAKDLRASLGVLGPATQDVLLGLDVPEPLVAHEVDQMLDVTLAPTQSRSVLGTMNDLAFMARTHLDMKPGTSLLHIALHLAQVPCGPLRYERPADVARQLLSERLH